jgi:5-formyltetrahydrofolate cyclo-ligase
MDTIKDKVSMRNALRKLRKDYVTHNASKLEAQYAQLAQFAGALIGLNSLVQHSKVPGAAVDQAPRLVVASFKPQHSEINPKYLEEALMLLGASVVWPRVEGDHLRFFANDDVPAFVKGAYGLMEPGPKSSEKKPNIVLMPLLGFDEMGNRLGQGGGYYDRTLQRLNTNVLASALSIGVAWGCQQVAAIPVETHDMPLAGVITPSEFHRF